jgi:hypothetical protein
MVVAERSVSLTAEIVNKVAESKGVDPTNLNPPLGKAIDPETLESLSQFDAGYVEFEYAGYTVRVDTGGAVEIK